MPLKPVAVDGDVQAEVGSTFYPPADSGSWSAGAVTHETYPALKVAGVAVAYQARCTFSFTGADSKNNGAAVSGSETVTLSAPPNALMRGQHAVLRDGDHTEGTYGNKLRVSATGKLRS